jgi:hypothetical protein
VVHRLRPRQPPPWPIPPPSGDRDRACCSPLRARHPSRGKANVRMRHGYEADALDWAVTIMVLAVIAVLMLVLSLLAGCGLLAFVWSILLHLV